MESAPLVLASELVVVGVSGAFMTLMGVGGAYPGGGRDAEWEQGNS